eukprot:TRINITY_DN5717_c0_g1_i2.p1 TRINITY_DN5717_c0_g1~~TRINITY_DN5717_c0_g1_i2.p1  ORF type:complete len:826 (-),score=133.28 TRINITY_DN5717_c0_g1_i2:145-2622(-)
MKLLRKISLILLSQLVHAIQADTASSLELSLILDESLAGHNRNEAAVAAMQSGNIQEALKKLRKAMRKHPDNVALQNTLGVALMYSGSAHKDSSQKEVLHQAAAEAFHRALRLARETQSVRGEAGQSDVEVVMSNQAVTQKHLEAARLNKLGIKLDLQNRWEEAAVAFQGALATGFDPFAANNLGSVIYKNATHRSSGWEEAEPLYQQARQLVETALKHLPGNPAVLKSLREVKRLQNSLKAWRDGADLKRLPVPETLLRSIAVNGSIVCTWSGGGAKFSQMAMNLLSSIRLHAPQWEKAFVVLALDRDTEMFFRTKGVTVWLHQTIDIYMTRWRLLAGILATKLNVLLLDTDIVFLGDPFPHFRKDADLEVMTDHLFPGRDLWDPKWRDEEHINTGFMFARGTQTASLLIQGFIEAHHSPWASDEPVAGIGGGFDLFDQRIFSRYIRKQIESERCFSMYEDKTFGKKKAGIIPSVRVHDPEVIAHGASFFWLRSHRLRNLSNPPVAHANFGRHKLYFMRDRGVWFIDDVPQRFKAPPEHDEYFPAVSLPSNLFQPGESSLAFGGSEAAPRFLRFQPQGRHHRSSSKTSPADSDLAKELRSYFLSLMAALEIATALGRVLVLPESFNCTLLPVYKPYQMSTTFSVEEQLRCTFDYFADALGFIKRFGHLIAEAGFTRTPYFQKLGGPSVFSPDILEIGFGDGDDVLHVRDLMRRKLGTEQLRHSLFRCQWIDFEAWFFALRPGQAPPTGERACGLQGVDCCSVYHGWAEKLEYFTGVAWDLPCDCGIGEESGCIAHGEECLHRDDIATESPSDLAKRLRRDFGEL